MPNKTGRFHLYSDTSKYATGSALYQIQNGKNPIDCIHEQEASRSHEKLYHNRTRAMWFIHKYSKFFTFAQKN